MAGAEVRGGHRASASPRGPWRARTQRGAVTAETAAVLPVLMALALGLVWCLSLVVAQVRVVDGAREVARVSARGGSDGAAVAAGRRVAPDGTVFRVRREGDSVVVEVRLRVHGPGGIFGHLPGPTVRSRAVAVAEPT